MRNRHISRICRHCDAPLASGSGTCWRCGVQWATEDEPRTTLRLVAGEAQDRSRSDVERWTNEGGTFRPDVAVDRRAAVRK